MALALVRTPEAKVSMSGAGEYPTRVLQQIALAANSSLELEDVMERLARLTLDAVPGDRCAIFMLDSGKLVPSMAVGRVPNDPEFRRFLRSAPIELEGEPVRWEAFCRGRAMYLSDLASSPLVPQELVETFRPQRALVMPLVASGEPLGLLTVDWQGQDYECSEAEMVLLEAIGAYAALAVRNARLFERITAKARTLEQLVELADALNSAVSFPSLLELIAAAFRELLGASDCSINLVPGLARIGVRSATGAAHTSAGSAAGCDAVAIIAAENKDLSWLRGAAPVVYPDLTRSRLPRQITFPHDAGSAVLFPLCRPEGPFGFVLISFTATGRPDPEQLATGQTLAGLAASATARADLNHQLRQRLQKVEILHRLSDVVAGAAELDPTLRRLNDLMPAELGLELEAIALADRGLRDLLGAHSPSREQTATIRSWRAVIAKRQSPLGPKRTGNHLLAPLIHRRRVLGVLTASIDPDAVDAADDELLLAIASGCAEVVYKAGLRRELAESERRLAMTAERERIARDLHDSVGQLLTGLGMRLTEYAEDAVDPAWRARLGELRDLASRGSGEMRDAIQSLLFLQVRRKGLAKSLRELARKFEATTGIKVGLQVTGSVTSLATVAEDALFRVAHEALINVERHSGASSVSLTLTYGGDSVSVTVTDRGVGLRPGDPFGGSARHFGLAGLQRLLEEAGGELELWDLIPNGLRVEGRIALRTRGRSARPCR